ncbi:hypothetical protein HY495_00950 [Candidatus Woesearchaeota archaeon]|nr:hypothetical protein [Candidatus Woesearchaeota archaeon]
MGDTKMTDYNITLVYRNNDFFAEVVPSLQAQLAKAGIDAKAAVIPKATPREDVPTLLSALADQLSGRVVLSDRTTGGWVYDNKDSVGYTYPGYEFDYVVETGFASSIFGREFVDGRCFISRSREEFVDRMSGLVRKMLDTGTPVPTVVGVSDAAILDHDPFNDRVLGYTDERILGAYNTVRDALVKGGIPEERIERVSASNRQMQREIPPFQNWNVENKTPKSSSTAWAIHDRHAHNFPDIYGSVDPLVSVVRFELPLGNFYRSAVKNGLIHAGSSEAIAYMVEIVKEIMAEEM